MTTDRNTTPEPTTAPRMPNLLIDKDQLRKNLRGALNVLPKSAPFYETRNLTPEHMESLYRLGYGLYTAGQYGRAVHAFQILCVYDHRKVRNWMALGGALQHVNRHGPALSAFTFATLLDPRNPEPRMHAADSCVALKDFKGALEAAQSVVRLCGDEPKYAALKSRAESLSGAMVQLAGQG